MLHRPAQKKVLMITDVDFWSQNSGHRVRISSLVSYLATHVHLCIAYAGPASRQMESVIKEAYKADMYILEPDKYLNSNGYGKRLKAFLSGKDFDTIIIEYIHNSYFLNFLNRKYQLILDTHDIIHQRTLAFKKFNLENAVYSMDKTSEAEIFQYYDNVIAICEPDYDTASQLTGTGNVLLCPHPTAPTPQNIRAEVQQISFIASEYFPNRDAISFFLKECWPAIHAAHPAVKLCIYGSVAYVIDISDTTGVYPVGYHPSLQQVYSETDVVINPVRFGAGLKIKNIEALANGLPLVTTSHGCRGISNENNSFMVADTPQEICTAVCRLIENRSLRVSLGRQALALIAHKFTPEKCFTPLLQAIETGTIVPI